MEAGAEDEVGGEAGVRLASSVMHFNEDDSVNTVTVNLLDTHTQHTF